MMDTCYCHCCKLRDDKLFHLQQENQELKTKLAALAKEHSLLLGRTRCMAPVYPGHYCQKAYCHEGRCETV